MTKQEIEARLKVLRFAKRSLATKVGRVRKEIKELERMTPTKPNGDTDR